MPLCAYCDRDEILTREHLFPEFLARRSPGYGTYIDHSRPNRPLRAVPVIRDVCAKCNNERLSELDAYADELAAKYFAFLVDRPIHVKFECDTNKLLSWLLKLLYNDARASKGQSVEIYRGLRAFILGTEQTPPFPMHILAGIVAPANIPDHGLEYPEHRGFAYIRLHPLSDWILFSRGVFLNSYFFLVLAWRDDVPKSHATEDSTRARSSSEADRAGRSNLLGRADRGLH
jgi:hypothetical protein